MNPDPLATLRDIYLPLPPGWWPPAPGWWILTALGLIALVWLCRKFYQRWLVLAPVRAAKALLSQSFDGGRSDEALVNQTNEILKRLLVVALQMQPLGRLSGDRWLLALDSISGSKDFSQGPGRVLGTDRFAPELSVQRDALYQAVTNLLSGVKPLDSSQALNAMAAASTGSCHD